MNVKPTSDRVVTYLRDEIFFKLKRDGSLSGTRKPCHPNCTSAKSPKSGADRLSPFRSGHMMRLRQHVGRYCLHLRCTFLIILSSTLHSLNISFNAAILRYISPLLESPKFSEPAGQRFPFLEEFFSKILALFCLFIYYSCLLRNNLCITVTFVIFRSTILGINIH